MEIDINLLLSVIAIISAIAGAVAAIIGWNTAWNKISFSIKNFEERFADQDDRIKKNRSYAEEAKKELFATIDKKSKETHSEIKEIKDSGGRPYTELSKRFEEMVTRFGTHEAKLTDMNKELSTLKTDMSTGFTKLETILNNSYHQPHGHKKRTY